MKWRLRMFTILPETGSVLPQTGSELTVGLFEVRSDAFLIAKNKQKSLTLFFQLQQPAF